MSNHHAPTYGNGLVFKQSLDSQHRPFERQVQQNTSAVLLSTYRYDNNSNIESITDGVQASKSLTLRYDNLDRLYNAAAGHIGNITLGYDTLGNIWHKQIFSTTHTYHYDANTQRLASAMGYNFAYDSRGNVTGKNAQTFSYNRANQLTSSGALQYAYDGHGRRVKPLKSNQKAGPWTPTAAKTI